MTWRGSMVDLQLQQSTPAEPVDTAADLELQRSESPVDRDIINSSNPLSSSLDQVSCCACTP